MCNPLKFLETDFLVNLTYTCAAIDHVIYGVCSRSSGYASSNAELPREVAKIGRFRSIGHSLREQEVKEYFSCTTHPHTPEKVIAQIYKEKFPSDFYKVNLIDLGRGLSIGGMRALLELQRERKLNFSPSEMDLVSLADIEKCIVLCNKTLVEIENDSEVENSGVVPKTHGNSYHGRTDWHRLFDNFNKSATISQATLDSCFHDYIYYHIWRLVELLERLMSCVKSDDVKRNFKTSQCSLSSKTSCYMDRDIKRYLVQQFPVVIAEIIITYLPPETFLERILQKYPFPNIRHGYANI